MKTLFSLVKVARTYEPLDAPLLFYSTLNLETFLSVTKHEIIKLDI